MGATIAVSPIMLRVGRKDTLPYDDLARTPRIPNMNPAGCPSLHATARSRRGSIGKRQAGESFFNSLSTKLVRNRRALIAPQHVELDDLLIFELLE